MPALNSLLLDLKHALIDSMSKGFILTIFVSSCIVCCFGIVGNIVLCVCFPGKKIILCLAVPLPGFDIMCIVGDLRKVLMIPLLHGFFLGGHVLKSKWWEDYLLHKECRSFYKLFLILSLLILFIEKFRCPISIIVSMAKDRRSFVLTT